MRSGKLSPGDVLRERGASMGTSLAGPAWEQMMNNDYLAGTTTTFAEGAPSLLVRSLGEVFRRRSGRSSSAPYDRRGGVADDRRGRGGRSNIRDWWKTSLSRAPLLAQLHFIFAEGAFLSTDEEDEIVRPRRISTSSDDDEDSVLILILFIAAIAVGLAFVWAVFRALCFEKPLPNRDPVIDMHASREEEDSAGRSAGRSNTRDWKTSLSRGLSSVGPGSASRGRAAFGGKRPRFIKTKSGGLRENSSLGRGISSESDSRARGMDRGMSGDSEYDASPDSTSRGRSWSVPAKFNSSLSFSRGISSDSRGPSPSSSNGRGFGLGRWKSKIVAPEQDEGTPLPGAVT